MDEKRAKGKKRGAILIITFMAIAVLVLISMGMFLRMLSESRASERNKDTTEAFYLAEAAIDAAVAKLPSNTASEVDVPLGRGRYSLTITVLEVGKKWRVLGMGYIPDMPPNDRAHKTIEAFLAKKDLADFFWDNAILSAGNVTFKGKAYTVVGNVRYANSISGDSLIPPANNIHDPQVSPLALLDFVSLRTTAASQGHVYTGYSSSMPQTFWFDQTDPDPTKWIPNVIYIEGDLRLAGVNDILGGFIIVGGDVIQNVDVVGSATIEGCIYTRGYFQNKGGGNRLTVNGGIWAGTYGDLTGNVEVTYNKTYMDAIRYNLNPSTEVQLISWREE